jgi:hypothetical protein
MIVSVGSIAGIAFWCFKKTLAAEKQGKKVDVVITN